ncbi:hypothetical protein AMTRI_Chr12g234000 [Amborella trichopoda]
MASTHVSLIMISLFFVAAVPSILALTVNGANVSTEPGALGIPNAQVEVVCGTDTMAVVQTQSTRAYEFTLVILETDFDPAACNIEINQPIASCTRLLPSAFLRASFFVAHIEGQTLNLGVQPLVPSA